MTLLTSDLCFLSIFEDIGDYVPSTTKTPRDKERERYRERERDRERDRDRDRDRERERERDRERERERDREREEEKKRHSYFEKPKVDDEVRWGPWHPGGVAPILPSRVGALPFFKCLMGQFMCVGEQPWWKGGQLRLGTDGALWVG